MVGTVEPVSEPCCNTSVGPDTGLMTAEHNGPELTSAITPPHSAWSHRTVCSLLSSTSSSLLSSPSSLISLPSSLLSSVSSILSALSPLLSLLLSNTDYDIQPADHMIVQMNADIVESVLDDPQLIHNCM